MKGKIKGSAAERELIHLFWSKGWAAVRVAGSGSMKYPCPDIIAGNSNRKILIECKSTKGSHQYLTKEEIEGLKFFAELFGGEAWVGVKFGTQWYFLNTEDLKETKKNFGISHESAKFKGLFFEEFLK